VAQHYRDANVIGVLELHTFSSLDPTYLPQYRGSLRGLEHRLVLVDAEALAIKHKQPIGHQQLRAAFRDRRMVTAGTQDEVKAFIRESLKPKGRNVILLMSSGALAGITPDEVVALAQAGT
jgi:UDP-N-acetylmuramate: L-alanyl-gamma-D-glutamyl-meso-diaminopimelate ligase